MHSWFINSSFFGILLPPLKTEYPPPPQKRITNILPSKTGLKHFSFFSGIPVFSLIQKRTPNFQFRVAIVFPRIIKLLRPIYNFTSRVLDAKTNVRFGFPSLKTPADKIFHIWSTPIRNPCISLKSAVFKRR